MTRVAAVLAIFVAVSSLCGYAETLIVSKTTPCRATKTFYTTIQAAVNVASSGAVIDVCPGTYAEQVKIGIPLVLTGISNGNADEPTITVPSGGIVANTTVTPRNTSVSAGAQILVQGTAGVTIQNLSIDGSNSGLTDCNTAIVGIYYQNASGVVRSVTVQNQVGFAGCGLGFGAYVETDGSATSTVTIATSTVQYTSGPNIGATAAGTTATIEKNNVVGSSVSLDNGIYVAGGATGTVSRNSVINFVSSPDSLGDATDATCGIAVSRKSQNVTVSNNSIGNTEAGVCLYANANNNTVSSNKIFSTQFNDGIYICSSGNLVQHNVISTSTDAAIRLDNGASPACAGQGNNNTITHNTINGSCIGVLEPTGTSGNGITPNDYINVTAITSSGICP